MRLSTLLLPVCLLATVAAHADDIRTFSLIAVGQSTGQTSGTFTINATTGAVLDVNLTAPIALTPANNPLVSQGFDSSTYTSAKYGPVTDIEEYFAANVGNHSELVDLYLPVASFIGFTGGPLCGTSYLCPALAEYAPDNIQGGYSYFRTGSRLTYAVGYGQAIEVTPEPSAFALLSTGLLGAFGAIRRRM